MPPSRSTGPSSHRPGPAAAAAVPSSLEALDELRSSPSISDYAIIGDCHTAALVSRAGSIDWLCLPAFHSPSWFARILDREGGHFQIRPRGRFTSTRRYVPDTNVLCTRFDTATGVFEVEDSMPVASYRDLHSEMRADQELVRRLRGVSGAVDVEIEVAPRPDYARARPTIHRRGAFGFVCTHRGDVLVVRSRPDVLRAEGESLRGAFRLREGERAEVSMSFARDEPAIAPALGEEADAHAEATIQWWRAWNDRCRYEGPYVDAVRRSMLTLRLLLFAPSGGLVAAPTTSLPEAIGGSRNWDYRYCWLRDAVFTVEALCALGFHAEEQSFINWVLYARRRRGDELYVLYDLYGHRHPKEQELPHLEGFRGSRPVRIGNAASRQTQVDAYGELVEAIASHYLFVGRAPDHGVVGLLRDLGGWICDHWEEPDEGIWEPRSGPRRHTFSRAMCASALAKLRRLDEAFELGLHEPRMAHAAASIREAIDREGWSEARGSYVASVEHDHVDASLLLLGRLGVVDPASPRMRATVARVMRDLEVRPGLVRRYPVHFDDGLEGEEGAFGVCGFWLVEALARQGDVDAARERFERLLGLANDVGLFAEEMAVPSGAPLGNFPQALTHLGLIGAALALDQPELLEGGGLP